MKQSAAQSEPISAASENSISQGQRPQRFGIVQTHILEVRKQSNLMQLETKRKRAWKPINTTSTSQNSRETKHRLKMEILMVATN